MKNILIEKKGRTKLVLPTYDILNRQESKAICFENLLE